VKQEILEAVAAVVTIVMVAGTMEAIVVVVVVMVMVIVVAMALDVAVVVIMLVIALYGAKILNSNRLPQVSIQSQINPTHILTQHFHNRPNI
jgi:hypothetical protein